MVAMSVLQIVHHRLFLVTVQQMWYMALLLSLLFIDGLSAQTNTVPKTQACNSSNLRNMSQTCMCTIGTVRCTGIFPKLVSVPMGITQTAKILDLSDNAIRVLNESDFHGLERLQQMVFQDNVIFSIHPNAFRTLIKLEILFLENNNFSRIEADAFKDLLELKYLNLSRNNIGRIEENDFSGLKNMRILALQDNSISDIHPDAFRTMSKLEILFLEKNNISRLHPNEFKNLLELKYLNLSSNTIKTIEENDFVGLMNLQILTLQDNGIASIHQNAFRNMSKLEILYLEKNKLTQLDSTGRTFQHLSALRTLDLSGNLIESISKDAFTGLDRVQRIYLQDNKISYIHPNAFNNLHKLEILYLERNGLSELDPSGSIFQNLSALQQLDLGGNKIHRIEQNDFLGLESVKKIFLQNNAISYMHPDAFKNLFQLEKLNLENNKLSELDSSGHTFQHLSSLETLCLGNNSISTVNKNSFLTLVASGKTVSVNMGQNPVLCDCNVWAIRSWKRSLPAGRIEFINLKCENDDQKRLYQDVEETVFGFCSSTRDSVFGETIFCPTCVDQRTNLGCNSKGESQCNGQSVCRKTMKWDPDEHAMLVASDCDEYHKCLLTAASNKETCVIDSKTNKFVDCNFCCRGGATCTEASIGGRSKDVRFFLSFINNATYQSFMADTRHPQYLKEKEQIETTIRSYIRLKGGIDVDVLQIIPQQQNQQYQVLMRLDVTTFNTETEESLESDAKKFLQDPELSLYHENVIQHSFTVSSYNKGQCAESVSYSVNMGNITWKASPTGQVLAPCPYNSPLNPELTYASRTCFRNTIGSVVWGEADYSSCLSKEEQDEPPDREKIFNVSISAKNAGAVSTILKDFIEKLDVTVDEVNKMMTPLELLINETNLEQPGVIQNVVDSLSNLINIDEETLLELEPQTSISTRLLTIIDDISVKAPLTKGKLVVMTPNLAIAAQEVNVDEPQNVVLNVGGHNDSMVSVGFSNENDSQVSGQTNMVIPMQAVLATLNSTQRQSISRVSFAVHQSDKLFNSLGNRESKGVQLANITDNDFCDTNNSYNCSRKNYPFITKINSNIISASVPGLEVRNLSEYIMMTFRHKETNSTNGRCVFWKKYSSNDTGEWSNEGCVIMNSSSHETTCGCNHLTNFALFMDIYQEGSSLSELDRKVLSIISYVGCGISLCALLLTLLSYSVLRNMTQFGQKNLTRKLRGDNPSKILVNLCLALMFSNLIYLVGMQEYTFDNTASCKIVAVLLHYFLLSSLCWMAVEAFYMYLALVLVFKTHFNNFILKCSLVGWGVPLVIIVITLGISATENYGFINSGLCWLRNPAFYGAFVGPVCLILLINCLAFGLVVKQLVGISSSKLSKTDRYGTIQHLRAAVGVVILLGLTWLFAIFAIGQASVAFNYLFALFNSLQGLFIFIYYCLLKKDIITIWKNLLPCFEVERGETTISTSGGRAMTSLASTHHQLIKHDSKSKTETATFLGNTVSVASTTVDSAGLSNVSNNNPNDSSE